MAEQQQFWFNTKTMKVEQGRKTLALYRIGPFATYEEASKALEIVKDKSTKWSKEDEDQS